MHRVWCWPVLKALSATPRSATIREAIYRGYKCNTIPNPSPNRDPNANPNPNCNLNIYISSSSPISTNPGPNLTGPPNPNPPTLTVIISSTLTLTLSSTLTLSPTPSSAITYPNLNPNTKPSSNPSHTQVAHGHSVYLIARTSHASVDVLLEVNATPMPLVQTLIC